MRALILLCCVTISVCRPVTAWAQQDAEPEADSVATEGEAPPLRYGVGLRVRGVFVPKSVFERFADVVPSGVRQPEIGLEVIRGRRGFEASASVAWASLSTDEGIWLIDFNDADDNPSFVEFDGFSWLSVDVNAVWSRPLERHLAFRYGMGIGVGVLLGDILETDYACPNSQYDLESCRQASEAVDLRKVIDVPPVVPIINGLIGLQYAPTPTVAINLDAGIHTALFVGIRVDFFFQ